MDWKNYVESLSVVEQTLREDPAGMYAGQDFATRDRYRHVIEDVARRSSFSELDVARAAIALAQTADRQRSATDRCAHVGYYLIDHGRPNLERAVSCYLPWKWRAGRAARHIRLTLYLGPIVLLTLLATAVVLSVFDRIAPDDWRYWFFALTGLMGVSALAVPLVNLIMMTASVGWI